MKSRIRKKSRSKIKKKIKRYN